MISFIQRFKLIQVKLFCIHNWVLSWLSALPFTRHLSLSCAGWNPVGSKIELLCSLFLLLFPDLLSIHPCTKWFVCGVIGSWRNVFILHFVFIMWQAHQNKVAIASQFFLSCSYDLPKHPILVCTGWFSISSYLPMKQTLSFLLLTCIICCYVFFFFVVNEHGKVIKNNND